MRTSLSNSRVVFSDSLGTKKQQNRKGWGKKPLYANENILTMKCSLEH